MSGCQVCREDISGSPHLRWCRKHTEVFWNSGERRRYDNLPDYQDVSRRNVVFTDFITRIRAEERNACTR